MFDFFISDTHFYHKNIIKYCHRPFASVEEMNRKLVENYNSVVGKNDTVLWCGDNFFCGGDAARKITSQLNGKKVSLLGNHDPKEHSLISRGFEFVADKLYMKIANRKVVACHYDCWETRSTWDDRYKTLRPTLEDDEVLIHGHTHQKQPVLFRQLNVGVDAWNFTPVPFSEVEKLISKMKPSIDSYKKDIKLLEEYRILVRQKAEPEKREETLELLKNEKFDQFRGLGWEAEFEKQREM